MKQKQVYIRVVSVEFDDEEQFFVEMSAKPFEDAEATDTIALEGMFNTEAEAECLARKLQNLLTLAGATYELE